MLELLRISNLALIEDVSMEFLPGMNVLTGETGAGKSFILKALNFVIGEKPSTELVRPGKEKAVVEALFILEGKEVILRRELMAKSGRSRLYINDQLASQDTVKTLRPSLIVHTSQHGQQKLLQTAYHAKMLDSFMQRPELVEKKDKQLKKLISLINERKFLEKKTAELEEKRDILEFQQQEIQKVNPRQGEEEELEVMRAAFRNQADIGEFADSALECLRGEKDFPGILSLFSNLERSLGKLISFDESFTPAVDVVLEASAGLNDLEARLRKLVIQNKQEMDIEALEARLYMLSQLKRKLNRSLPAIFALEKEVEDNLAFLDSCEMEHKRIAMEEDELCVFLTKTLLDLNKAREMAAQNFSVVLQKELGSLGFSPEVEVLFSFTATALHPDRDDCIEQKATMLWKPNPGQPPQALDKIASGGELSRFLLAVVSIMSRLSTETPTLIFDEVDAGVGGLTLNSMGATLDELAASRQMLLITHWPQLAARAHRHFFIKKSIVAGQTYVSCSLLAPTEIDNELVRMSGGGDQEAALARRLRHS